ncbi:MAG: BMP family ABC transporter substrate-binding protein [Terriglobia bacterium]|nr:MAG: BMP family ABC transporter substrate-binding protein [Terriglobia bacterium]
MSEALRYAHASGLSRRRCLALLAAAPRAAPDSLAIGFVYNGPKNDLGYNQAHAEGKQSLKSVPYVRAFDEASVPETVAVEESMRNMIYQDSARVVFATSYGFLDPFVFRVARENPAVQFFHCGGSYRDGLDPRNVGIYFGFIDEVEYLAGMTAGLATRTGRMGFVAAKPIPQVLRNINSFMLGARSVNPSVTMRVVFTGDWVLPVREAEASSSLADQGVDVLTGHTGSPRVIVQVAERRGIFATGYQFNQSVLAPRGFLTGAEWAWGVVYRRYAELIHAGKSVADGSIPRRMTGTLKDEFCRLSPFGPAVTAQHREAISAAKQRLLNGSQAVYRGPLRDNTGKTVVPAGITIRIEDPVLDQMNWLLDGILGDVRS